MTQAEALGIFNAFSRVVLPIFFVIDIWLTHLIKKDGSNIGSTYYKIQKNIGEIKLVILKGMYVLLAWWCTSEPSWGMGRSPDFAIPLIYMLAIPTYALEFIRYRWRVKHGLEPSMQAASEAENQDGDAD